MPLECISSQHVQKLPNEHGTSRCCGRRITLAKIVSPESFHLSEARRCSRYELETQKITGYQQTTQAAPGRHRIRRYLWGIRNP